MNRLVRWTVLAIGLSMLLVAVVALIYSTGPVARQTEQMRPPATLFVPPP